jgi:hypothetical protein
MMRASKWRSLVRMPHCEPVKEMASHPRAWMARDSRAMETRSPVVTSMSSSRRAGAGGIPSTVAAWYPSSSRESVAFAMALTTTTT